MQALRDAWIEYSVFNRNFSNDDVIVVPDGVKEIANMAFLYSKCSKIVLPEGLERIGDSAFTNCINLCEINIPDSVVEIDDQAFQFCKKLQHIDLPAGLSRINSHCFSLSGIKKIVIPEGVEAIDDKAFSFSEIEMITLPESLRVIHKKAFEACFNLKRVIIKGSDLAVEDGAFLNCKSLVDINPMKISVAAPTAFCESGVEKVMKLESEMRR